MNKPSQLPRQTSARHAPAQGSARNGGVRPTVLQAKPGASRPESAARVNVRTPNAPPAYRPQPTSQAAQAKLHAAAPQPARATVARTASRIIQANIIGGTQALQARLSLLCAHAQTPNNAHARSTAQRKAGANATPAPRSQRQPVKLQTIQRKSGQGVDAFQVPLQAKNGGQPIPDQVRAKMEAAFGTDFSDVRIHVGQEASSIGAIAYTWGTNIHFAPGQYSPHTIQGQKLLGHELWHVVQQKSGRVSNPFGTGVAVVQDHALEAEADRMGVKAAMTALVQRPDDKR
ncbi:MAG: hypothetical protein QOG71_3747 [Pyrinomonadaceae bacterium]|nr:hypothetical protein [Pyrinomonadaceae bacterium]